MQIEIEMERWRWLRLVVMELLREGDREPKSLCGKVEQ